MARELAGEPGTELIDRADNGFTLRARKIRVEVVSGPDAGTVVERAGHELSVGRRGCDFTLSDATASAHHLSLVIDDIGIRVVDKGSRNGTYLDGIRVRDAYARPDSLITLGNSTLRLALLDDVVELPLSTRQSFGGLLGASVVMRSVFAVLERVAKTNDTVLIEGETGTGKELAAEAIHAESPRASGPFVVFDCSAVPPNLIESELFGHVRGAFTGATSDRTGSFELADGGSLFLDEIGDLPAELQPKLLRVLERLEVRRVGSNQPRRCDVRIIAATNRSLDRQVAAGRFREDLFYRLAVVRVMLPPLRERIDDIPMLVEHFTRSLQGAERSTSVVSARTVSAFQQRSWPGNVRQLKNAVARVLSLGSPPNTEDSEPARRSDPAALAVVDTSVPLKVARERLLEAFERAYLIEALGKTEGNLTRAAELAGVERKFVQRAVKHYKLREEGVVPSTAGAPGSSE